MISDDLIQLDLIGLSCKDKVTEHMISFQRFDVLTIYLFMIQHFFLQYYTRACEVKEV
jgi:hypothetical protein